MRQKGFTLIELLVVLVIIGLMVSLVPMAFRGLPSLELKAATRELAGVFRAARGRAIRDNREYSTWGGPCGTARRRAPPGCQMLPDSRYSSPKTRERVITRPQLQPDPCVQKRPLPGPVLRQGDGTLGPGPERGRG